MILYFVKEDRGYSLLFMLVDEKIKEVINEGQKKIFKTANSLGITGTTNKLYLIQPELSILKQLHLNSILDHHKNIERKKKKSTLTQTYIDKSFLSELTFSNSLIISHVRFFSVF